MGQACLFTGALEVHHGGDDNKTHHIYGYYNKGHGSSKEQKARWQCYQCKGDTSRVACSSLPELVLRGVNLQ